jgi:hypothetical protein
MGTFLNPSNNNFIIAERRLAQMTEIQKTNLFDSELKNRTFQLIGNINEIYTDSISVFVKFPTSISYSDNSLNLSLKYDGTLSNRMLKFNKNSNVRISAAWTSHSSYKLLAIEPHIGISIEEQEMMIVEQEKRAATSRESRRENGILIFAVSMLLFGVLALIGGAWWGLLLLIFGFLLFGEL